MLGIRPGASGPRHYEAKRVGAKAPALFLFTGSPVRDRGRESLYGLSMTELPIFDARGGSLVSLVRLDSASPEDLDGCHRPLVPLS